MSKGKVQIINLVWNEKMKFRFSHDLRYMSRVLDLYILFFFPMNSIFMHEMEKHNIIVWFCGKGYKKILTIRSTVSIELLTDWHSGCFCGGRWFWLKMIWSSEARGLKPIIASECYSEKLSIWTDVPASFVIFTHPPELPVHCHKIGKFDIITSSWLFAPTL